MDVPLEWKYVKGNVTGVSTKDSRLYKAIVSNHFTIVWLIQPNKVNYPLALPPAFLRIGPVTAHHIPTGYQE